jgi:membrane protease YdiL (CAAX protease family)
MLQQYLGVVWRWMSTVFVKTLAVWCLVTLLAIVWVRPKRIRSEQPDLSSARDEALLSLVVMAVILAVLLPLNRVVDAAANGSLLLRFVVAAAMQLLMCGPVFVVLIVRRQGLETVGLARRNLGFALTLGAVLALVTVLLTAAASLMHKSPASAPLQRPSTEQILYWIATFTLSALAHEFVYRGYLQTRLTAWAGNVAGMLASSAVYSLWHLPGFLGRYNSITMLAEFVALFVFGLLLGEVRRRSRSIVPAALFHAANDIAHTLW